MTALTTSRTVPRHLPIDYQMSLVDDYSRESMGTCNNRRSVLGVLRVPPRLFIRLYTGNQLVLHVQHLNRLSNRLIDWSVRKTNYGNFDV